MLRCSFNVPWTWFLSLLFVSSSCICLCSCHVWLSSTSSPRFVSRSLSSLWLLFPLFSSSPVSCPALCGLGGVSSRQPYPSTQYESGLQQGGQQGEQQGHQPRTLLHTSGWVAVAARYPRGMSGKKNELTLDFVSVWRLKQSRRILVPGLCWDVSAFLSDSMRCRVCMTFLRVLSCVCVRVKLGCSNSELLPLHWSSPHTWCFWGCRWRLSTSISSYLTHLLGQNLLFF